MMTSSSKMIATVFLLVAVFSSTTTNAFQVTSSSSSASSKIQRSRLYSETVSPLTEVSESDSPFDQYDVTNIGQSLEIKDISVGNGDEIQKDDLITVRHTGTVMQDGSSLGTHEFQFQYLEPGRVMPGWSQGMEGMKVGGRRVLRIPPRLGYGNRKVGEVIPANAHLEFDVEVLDKTNDAWSMFLYKTGFKADARTAGIVVCLGYLALSPMIESKLNSLGI
mmetsp:Transcript_31999/g.77851  ORF Transcript_31999/g.77851 Transcript_31999/m.77851 type:complete len:221 (-) Transcript_31999:136-798(-)